MANVNKVMLLGNVTRDPEVRYTPKGTAVTDLGLAVNRIRNNEQGERIEEVTYVDVTLWGRQAELAGQFLAKGRSVFIEGRLQLDQWEDKESGQKRSRLRVVCENMQFVGGGTGNAGGGSLSDSNGQRTGASPSIPSSHGGAADDHFGEEEDEIPF